VVMDSGLSAFASLRPRPGVTLEIISFAAQAFLPSPLFAWE